MKFILAFTALLGTSMVNAAEISSDSVAGQNILANARRLADNNADYTNTWLTGYSVKFQGCHSIKQWNSDANEEQDVRIETTNLVRFRMCPSDSCSATKSAGCTAGFGDYIIDMSTYISSAFEVAKQNTQSNCQKYLAASCNCVEGDDQADDFNVEYCEYDCYNNAKMTQCIDNNPYQDQGVAMFEVEEYLACAQFEVKNNRRQLNDNAQDEVKYYIGPYCANQGGSIFLGLFTDDSCTEAANSTAFAELAGYELPYKDTSLADANCLTCLEPVNQNDQNANDQADGDTVAEQCEAMYTVAGKCEVHLPNGTVTTPNEAACNYLEGIKIVRQDGIITSASTRPSAVATSFIVISAMAFCAMAFYVWYLRTRLGVKRDTLL
jgi:hypothetical protein